MNLAWLFPERRPAREAAPFRPVDMGRVDRAAHSHREITAMTTRAAINEIEMQQARGLLQRLAEAAEKLRELTNETIDRTQHR